MRELEEEIKKVIIEALELEDITAADIDSQAPLFGDGLGLDSIDALELGLALKNTYNIKIDPDAEVAKEHFYSVETLARFVESRGGQP